MARRTERCRSSTPRSRTRRAPSPRARTPQRVTTHGRTVRPHTSSEMPTLSGTARRHPARRPDFQAFAEPSDGLDPSTPSLPFKFELSSPVPLRPLPTEKALVTHSFLRDGEGRSRSRRDGLMLPRCCPAVSPAQTTRRLQNRCAPFGVVPEHGLLLTGGKRQRRCPRCRHAGNHKYRTCCRCGQSRGCRGDPPGAVAGVRRSLPQPIVLVIAVEASNRW